MVRTGARRLLALGLIAALSINAALLALMAPRGREVGFPMRPDTGGALRVELMRQAPEPIETEPVNPASRRATKPAQPSPEGSRPPLAQASSPAKPPPSAPSAQAGLASPPWVQSAKPGGVQDDSAGAATLRAKTALALRKLGACSRVNSGNGDAQDRELCSAKFATADGPSLDSIPDDKRAGYDAAHAKAGYLVPADAANPDFMVSQFKRGGTVVRGHAGCSLVEGKWSCVGH